MGNNPDILVINNKIQKIKLLFSELQQEADGIPAILKKSKRALASLKMMELNISDIVEFEMHK